MFYIHIVMYLSYNQFEMYIRNRHLKEIVKDICYVKKKRNETSCHGVKLRVD